jgi:hypothetical protein
MRGIVVVQSSKEQYRSVKRGLHPSTYASSHALKSPGHKIFSASFGTRYRRLDKGSGRAECIPDAPDELRLRFQR